MLGYLTITMGVAFLLLALLVWQRVAWLDLQANGREQDRRTIQTQTVRLFEQGAELRRLGGILTDQEQALVTWKEWARSMRARLGKMAGWADDAQNTIELTDEDLLDEPLDVRPKVFRSELGGPPALVTGISNLSLRLADTVPAIPKLRSMVLHRARAALEANAVSSAKTLVMRRGDENESET